MLNRIHFRRVSCSLNLTIICDRPRRSHEAAARERFCPSRIEDDRQKLGRRPWIGGYSLRVCWAPALLQPSVLRCRARLKRWLQSRHGPHPPPPVFPILMLPMSSTLRMYSMLRMQRPPRQIRHGKTTSNSLTTADAAASAAGGASADVTGITAIGAADAAAYLIGRGFGSRFDGPLNRAAVRYP